MKEKDFDRVIDDMIIEGLIKEGEQDNADFEAALRNMSEEDFLAMILEAHPLYELEEESRHVAYSFASDSDMDEYFDGEEKAQSASPTYNESKNLEEVSPMMAEAINKDKEESATENHARQHKPWRTWIAAAVSAAAVLAIVLIPAYRSMNTRICESALVACEAYMPPARGGMDISKEKIDMVKEVLPELEEQYNVELAGNATDPYAANLAETGWDLAIAYLRLGERSKAKVVLTELSKRYPDDEFGDQCRKIAEIL